MLILPLCNERGPRTLRLQLMRDETSTRARRSHADISKLFLSADATSVDESPEVASVTWRRPSVLSTRDAGEAERLASHIIGWDTEDLPFDRRIVIAILSKDPETRQQVANAVEELTRPGAIR